MNTSRGKETGGGIEKPPGEEQSQQSWKQLAWPGGIAEWKAKDRVDRRRPMAAASPRADEKGRTDEGTELPVCTHTHRGHKLQHQLLASQRRLVQVRVAVRLVEDRHFRTHHLLGHLCGGT